MQFEQGMKPRFVYPILKTFQDSLEFYHRRFIRNTELFYSVVLNEYKIQILIIMYICGNNR